MITDKLVVALSLESLNPDEISSGAYVDLTPNVRQVSINRGKSSIFSEFTAATVQIELNNNNGEFDPTNTTFRKLNPQSNGWITSEFMARRCFVRIGFGQFAINLGVDGERIFTGYTHDWNLSYSTSGQSIATLTLYDISGLLSETFLDADIPDEELSGVRYQKIYNANKPTALLSASADQGVTFLGDQLIPEGIPLVDYLNLIARTEGGYAFNNRFGRQTFVQRIKPLEPDFLKLGLEGIPISALAVSYGTELLYNKVRVQNLDDLEVVAENTDSQAKNGIKEIDLVGLVGATENESISLANYYLSNYSEPRLRFEQVEIAVSGLDSTTGISEDQEKLLQTEIGDSVEVSFQPNGTSSIITELRRIIGIRHSIRPGAYYINYTLDAVTHNNFILDDDLYGRLDVNQLF
jgi:hypothetical protein